MPTFEQRYCNRYNCRQTEFTVRLFAATLPWYIRPVSVLLGGLRGEFFHADRALLRNVAAASDLQQIDDEIRDYLSNPRNLRWLRQSGRFRISTRRLREIARDCGLARNP